jgi:hypothetical protein
VGFDGVRADHHGGGDTAASIAHFAPGITD